MRINIRHTLLAVCAVLAPAFAAVSCQERHPDNFADVNAVYFNNRGSGNALVDSAEVTFVYESVDAATMQVEVAVQLLGRAASYDRPVSVTVSSDNAVEGVDYIIEREAVLPAGEYSFRWSITLVRTPALERERKTILLELNANEHFSLALPEVSGRTAQVSALTFRVIFSEMFTSAPSAWDESILGEFTQPKFELVCKVLSDRIDPNDFNEPTIMTQAMQMYVYEEITSYISEQAALMEAGKDYDRDIIDPATGDPIVFVPVD